MAHGCAPHIPTHRTLDRAHVLVNFNYTAFQTKSISSFYSIIWDGTSGYISNFKQRLTLNLKSDAIIAIGLLKPYRFSSIRPFRFSSTMMFLRHRKHDIAPSVNI